jgi:probable F420-dependent oxidoreductase
MSVPIEMFTTPSSSAEAGELARLAEELGFDGWYTGETGFDSFVASTVAAMSTSEIRLGTAITLAFARNPMTVAYAANDLQGLSRGRFFLGLGSQIRQHIERRFSMPWSDPVARMSDYIDALHAIWTSWEEEAPLAFDGEFYKHDLMPPFFRGERHGYGRPEVGVAGVGRKMTELAGRKADALLAHPFGTPKFVKEFTRPWLDQGIKDAGRDPSEVALIANVFVVTGKTQEEYDRLDRATRNQIAFYASTPTYRDVLVLHGWEDLQEDLRAMTRRGLWDEMAGQITDEMLREFAVVTENVAEIAPAIDARLGTMVDRVMLSQFWRPSAEDVAIIQETAKSIRPGPTSK